MHKLPNTKIKSKKRLGRGYGSGKGGHTSSRGMKGQKSRSKIPVLFEGIKVKKSLLRRLPMKRGKDKFKPKVKPVILKTEVLNEFKVNEKVDLEKLVKAGIVGVTEARGRGVKILAGDKLTKKLTIELPTSKSAKIIIEKAGGKVK